MDIQRALMVIGALADGVDPETGEVLPPSSILQSPNVIRALICLIDCAKQAGERKTEANRKPPTNAGKPWTRDEDDLICSELKRGLNFSQIAQTHGRTRGAIVSRLIRLGQISPPAAPYKIA